MILSPGFSFPRLCVASHVNEELGQIQVSVLPRRFVKLYQRQLDFFMSGEAVTLIGPEDAVDMICILDGHVQQRAFSGRPIVRYRGLHQMARTIQLMFPPQIGPPLAGFRQREIGIEIPVARCAAAILKIDIVDGFLQHRVWMSRQRIPCALEDLEDVGVIEERTPEVALHQLARLGKVVDAAGPLTPIEVVRQRLLAVDFQSRRPKNIVELHIRERHGGQFAIFRLRCGDKCRGKGMSRR